MLSCILLPYNGFILFLFYPDTSNILNADFSGIVFKMTEALLEKHPKDFYYKGMLATSLPLVYQHLPSAIANLYYPTFVSFFHFNPPGAKTSRQSLNGKTDWMMPIPKQDENENENKKLHYINPKGKFILLPQE